MMSKIGRPVTGATNSQDGAVAIMVALTLTVLLLVSALVIDLAALRADRVTSKSVADMAVAAAAVEYDPLAAGSARLACLEALAFARANLSNPDLVLVANVACETVFPEPGSGEVCDSAAWDPPRTATYVGGNYELQITIPVPDGSPLMGDQVSTAGYDGQPCDRVGVRVTRERAFGLARVAGLEGGVTEQASVARWREDGQEDQYASMVVLQRDGCNTLRTSGQGNVEVVDGPPLNPGDPLTPGSITTDTVAEGQCGTGQGQNSHVINVAGNQEDQAFVRASGAIFMEALRQGQSSGLLYNEDRVPAKLSPRPRSGALITRMPIDHRYNCTTYDGTSGSRWSPVFGGTGYVGQEIPDCDENVNNPDLATPPPYIALLHSAYQPLDAGDIPTLDTADPSGPFADWLVYPRDVEGASCPGGTWTLGPSMPGGVPGGRSGDFWFIDCGTGTGGSGAEFAPDSVSFTDVRVVVSRNWINVGSGSFEVSGDADGAILYLQATNAGNQQNQARGIQRGSQAAISFDNTFVYSENGWVNVVGGAGGQLGPAISWRSATRDAACAVDGPNGAPSPGCFAPLALWSNSRYEHGMGGNSSMDVRGIFFTPNANTNLSGQAPQDLEDAQFFSYSFEISGQAGIRMAPDPAFNDPTPIGSSGLIR